MVGTSPKNRPITVATAGLIDCITENLLGSVRRIINRSKIYGRNDAHNATQNMSAISAGGPHGWRSHVAEGWGWITPLMPGSIRNTDCAAKPIVSAVQRAPAECDAPAGDNVSPPQDPADKDCCQPCQGCPVLRGKRAPAERNDPAYCDDYSHVFAPVPACHHCNGERPDKFYSHCHTYIECADSHVKRGVHKHR